MWARPELATVRNGEDAIDYMIKYAKEAWEASADSLREMLALEMQN
jgi:hypothetical protein